MNTTGTYYGATLLREENAAETTSNKITLEYYSMEKQMDTQAEETTLYGITIVKKEYNNKDIKFEKKTVEKVSSNKNIVMKIIRLLKDYKVTPIELEEVLEDLLKQRNYGVA